VPLPGSNDFAATHVGPPSRGAVPLPGSGYSDVPTSLQPAYGDAVPLPGDGSPHTAHTAQAPAYHPPPQSFSFDS
jgi:hypothetical protein